MVTTGSGADLVGLVKALIEAPTESEWVEFKSNLANPTEIGSYLSALSNGAALRGEPFGYLVWGVEDESHEIIGTSFVPEKTKKGGEDLVPWLTRGLGPQRWFEFTTGEIDGKRVVVLEVEAAQATPTGFDEVRWIRIGSYRKKLQQYPATEKELWLTLLDQTRRQESVRSQCSAGEVLDLLDIGTFLRLTNRSGELAATAQLELLEAQQLVSKTKDGRFEIQRHAALLFARDLATFAPIASKTIRLLEYPAQAKTGSPTSDQTYSGGYAVEFEAIYSYLTRRFASREQIDGARRTTTTSYPALAVRELLANALIHQDLQIHGAGPLIEIFTNRIEISNPGTSLVDIDRLLDHPPRSRNEQLADTMHQLGFCEKRGSGIDKVVEQVEYLQHPPPAFRTTANSLTATMFDATVVTSLRKDERIQALYLHSCLRYVNGERVTNESVRSRFGLSKEQASLASRYIKETVDAGLLSTFDPAAGRRTMSYVPFWATSDP